MGTFNFTLVMMTPVNATIEITLAKTFSSDGCKVEVIEKLECHFDAALQVFQKDFLEK